MQVQLELQPTPETVTIGPASIRWTDARHGDLSFLGPAAPSAAPSDAPKSPSTAERFGWMYARQVHGNNVLVVDNADRAGEDADAIVTRTHGLTISVQIGDCAPIALVGDDGSIAAVHAGWKGLRAGIIKHAAESMRELGATDIQAALGPCIHAECYEFGEDQLKNFAEHWGPSIIGETEDGTPAFDLPAAVKEECKSAGVTVVYESPFCTACSGQHFSYRKQQTTKRQVMLVNTKDVVEKLG